MSLSDWLSKHRVWQALEECKSAIKQAAERGGNTPNAIETIGRISSVQSFAENRLKAADPHLHWPELLDVLANSASQMAASLRSFAEAGDYAILASANSSANSIMSTCIHLHAPIHREELVGAREAAETYRRGLENLLNEAQAIAGEVRKDFDALRERFAELSKLMTDERGSLVSITTAWQDQFSNSQELRRAEHDALIKTFDSRAGVALMELKSVAADAEVAYGLIQKELTKTTDATIANITTEFLQKLEQYATKAEAGKSKIDELVGIVADKSIVTGHLGAANKAANSTRFWHAVTLFAMLGIIGVASSLAISPLSNSGQGGFDWSGLAARVFIALSFGVLASYGGVEAARYQRQERENRRKALELAALRPYVAELPKEAQDAFVVKIGEKMFGNSEPVYAADSPSPTNAFASLNTLVKTIFDGVNENVKAKANSPGDASRKEKAAE